MVYTITFNPAIDYVMHVEKLGFDDINRSKEESVTYGGKGINVSVILTRLGTENKALGFVGGFTGSELEKLLEKDAVVCDFNYLKNGFTRINVKIRTETELDINANGPEISESDVEQLLEKLDEIQKGDYLVLAGSIPKNLPNDIYRRIFKKLDGKGVNLVADAMGNLLLSVLGFRPFLIKPNHHELGDIFGVKTETEEEIVSYAARLQQMGARNVLVSRAEKGALLLDENGKVHKTENAKGELINSVGCGDSMVAGFVSGYIEKGDYAHALKLGSACGNATAFSPLLGSKEEIEKIFEKISVE